MYKAPRLPCFSLIGRIGNGEPFLVGNNPTISVPAGAEGELQLAVNDNYYDDNSKGWTVTIHADSSKTLSPSPSPSLLVLANLSDNVYAGNGGYGGYAFIANNCTLPPNTCMNVGFAAGAYMNSDASQIVIAVRGTVFSLNTADERLEALSTLGADVSFGGTVPTHNFATDVADAAAFVQQVRRQYPQANMTLTGHSLGGAMAQLLGQAGHFTTVAFNSPGAGRLYDPLKQELGNLTNLANPSYTNGNYRIYGDQVSLFGQPIGFTATLQVPAYTSFATDSTADSIVALYGLSGTFMHLHAIDTVVAQIADKAPEVSRTGEPNYVLTIERWAQNHK